ncbi:hypothetical protein P171DRAFT_184501 [Karstenula rhodostoma CBS 690.94]|uniref:Uncharacterized protein n=1 Tax=Karstenula rhodostoma CBS 690.94 TaxID=1392251 RepID=A0A9P4P2V8_9PLEO|nr:hypothetical protein P171DRAFT_184501 [Karstenula rhodostoma CBS 690.94]
MCNARAAQSNKRVPTADSRQQTADSRQQTAHLEAPCCIDRPGTAGLETSLLKGCPGGFRPWHHAAERSPQLWSREGTWPAVARLHRTRDVNIVTLLVGVTAALWALWALRALLRSEDGILHGTVEQPAQPPFITVADLGTQDGMPDCSR